MEQEQPFVEDPSKADETPDVKEPKEEEEEVVPIAT